MVRTIVSIDLNKSPREQKTPLHNRWHPEIPAVATVAQNETFRLECFDWTGGQVKNDDNARDILEADLTQVHYLSGPIAVEGAEPGDALEVELLDIQPLEGSEWGYTGIFDKTNGGCFLHEHYPKATKAIFDFNGIFASSRHIPGVKFPGLIHPGIIGTAPSQELLNQWNKREKVLIDGAKDAVPPVAYGPNAAGALTGKAERTTLAEKIKKEGARTVPPRENGGNCDIKNLSRGSKMWFPVFVPGGNLSIGDIHFSQGDGEITFCGGIEMHGSVTLRARVIKNGIKSMALKNPIFIPGPVEPRFSKYLTFEGISVDENGKQHFLDATLAYKQACLNCIEYFKKFGYTGEQIFTLLSACPCEGRINSIVDVPNACCSVAVPVDIFEFDVTPKDSAPVSINRGNVALILPK